MSDGMRDELRSDVNDDVTRVREMRDVGDPQSLEVLYWVGCAAAADERVGNIARCMVRIMNRAGVRFAILGSEECCTGDPARRTGNELQFDALARANIETFSRYGVKRIVTHCPHCFHTLRNEYPELGGTYEVIHHTEFLSDLLSSGRLRVTGERNGAPRGGRNGVPGGAPKGAAGETITFHDPCYLSRHNGITEPPREVLHRLGVAQVEMKRSGEKNFCCGAGGGHAFFDERDGGMINLNRAREAVATGAKTVCTACPFCLPMLEDGLRGAGAADTVRVRDLAEIVDELSSDAE